jgi:hypothetical protein
MAAALRPSTDRAGVLASERRQMEIEIDKLRREEQDLTEKVRRAREQVRYYSSILQRMKFELTGATNPNEIVRRLR